MVNFSSSACSAGSVKEIRKRTKERILVIDETDKKDSSILNKMNEKCRLWKDTIKEFAEKENP